MLAFCFWIKGKAIIIYDPGATFNVSNLKGGQEEGTCMGVKQAFKKMKPPLRSVASFVFGWQGKAMTNTSSTIQGSSVQRRGMKGTNGYKI